MNPTAEIAANLGLDWPPPKCACGCGNDVEAYNIAGQWKWRSYLITTKKAKGHSPKRSVRWDVPKELQRPIALLEIAYKAYKKGREISPEMALKHASVICTPYLGGFRIEESLPLRKSQFKAVKVDGHDFMVIEGAVVEKSSGRTLDRPIVVDDPMFVPLKAWLELLGDSSLLFPGNRGLSMTTANAETIVKNASEGKAWPHMFRSVRTSFLLRRLKKPEVDELMGWSDGSSDMVPWYGQSVWEKYANPLVKMTHEYWANEASYISSEVKAWIEFLQRKEEKK